MENNINRTLGILTILMLVFAINISNVSASNNNSYKFNNNFWNRSEQTTNRKTVYVNRNSTSRHPKWIKTDLGWKYLKKDGSYANSEWIYIYINDKDSEFAWKYFNNQGINIDQFFKENGKTWLSIAGPSHSYHRGWWVDPENGYKYYFRETSGSRVEGRQYIDNGWVYFRNSGTQALGWQYYNNSWRYNNPENNGYEVTSAWKWLPTSTSDKKYNWKYFNSSGQNINQFYKENNKIWLSQPGPSSDYYKGWWIDPENGQKYYFRTNSGSRVEGRQFIDGSWRYFRNSGTLATGWQYINNIWCYFAGEYGAQLLGRNNISGIWYYLPTEHEVNRNLIKNKIKGNKNSNIYHVPGQRFYEITKDNVLYLETERDAQKLGFRRSKI